MHCINCGQKIIPGAKFCKKCGASVAEHNDKEFYKDEKLSDASKQNDSQQPPSVGHNAAVLGAWLLVAVTIVGLIYYIANPNIPNTVISQNQNTATPSTFYTQSDVNVRNCASIDCKSVWQYPVNTRFNLPYASVNDLPDWVYISWQDSSGISNSGYISKTILGQHKVITEVSQRAITSNKQKDLPTIIKEWAPRITKINCRWFTPGASLPYLIDQGSATFVNMKNLGITAVTNWHVIIDDNGYIPNDCNTKEDANYFPIDLSSHFGFYGATYNRNDNPFSQGNGDVGYIRVDQKDIDAAIKKVTETNLNVCTEEPILGDQVIILGYPWNGSSIGITSTQGVISGIEIGSYVTDAKIDHGNSGGAAILVKNDCYLGIPSAAVVGTIESYGRILSAKYVFQQ